MRFFAVSVRVRRLQPALRRGEQRLPDVHMVKRRHHRQVSGRTVKQIACSHQGTLNHCRPRVCTTLVVLPVCTSEEMRMGLNSPYTPIPF